MINRVLAIFALLMIVCGVCLAQDEEDIAYLKRKKRNVTVAAGLGTPTLKASYGSAGISGNSSDTGNDYHRFLEASGTASAVASGDLILVAVANRNGVSPTVTDDISNTYTSGVSCAKTSGITQPRKWAVFWASSTGVATNIKVHFASLTTDVQIYVAVFYNTATVSPIDGAGKCTFDITPLNNTAPNVSAGNLTGLTSGDLIFNWVVYEGDGVLGDSSNGVPTLNGITYGSGFTGLYAEMVAYGAAAQYQILSGTSINAGITMNQTTAHDAFASIVVPIKAGNGGSAPGAGMRIVSHHVEYANAPTNVTRPCSIPSVGNLVVITNESGGAGINLTSVTDSDSDTYTQITDTSGNSSINPQVFYAANLSPNLSRTCTLHFGTGSGASLVSFYDVKGASASPLDTGATVPGGGDSSVLTATSSGASANSCNVAASTCAGAQITFGTLFTTPSIKPSVSSGIIIGALNQGNGPVGCHSGAAQADCTSTPASPSGVVFDFIVATWCTGASCGDLNAMGNGDGAFHKYFTSNATVSFQFTDSNQAVSAAQGLAVVFK